MKCHYIYLFIIYLFISCSPEKPTPKPNIIYILADDLGYGELGAYGQEKIETPIIDKLASTGIKFTQHYSGAPVCAPARSVFLTGLHTGHTPIRGNHEWGERGEVWNFAKAVNDPNLEGQFPMPDSTNTVAKALKSAGYQTGMIGKWGLGGPLSNSIPTKMGFDFFYGYNCQRQAHTYYPKHLWDGENKDVLNNKLVAPNTKLSEGANPEMDSSYSNYTLTDYAPELMHNRALGFIKENKDKTFFLYYASPIPHAPLQAPEKWVKHYQEKFGEEEPYIGNKDYFPNRTPRATYAAMVSYLDEQVGEIIQTLDTLGIRDNTLIIFTSDNGPTFNGGTDSEFFDSAKPFKSEYGWGKGFTKEGGIRVPFVANWPGIIQPAESDLMSSFYDMMPTFCDLAGIKTPKTDGISILNTLKGKIQQNKHDFLYWEFPSYGGQQAVRLGDWKAIKTNILSNKKDIKIELFNLISDPLEQTDVADQNPLVMEKIIEIMTREHTVPIIDRFKMSKLGDNL